ncbi:MAG: transglycosylase domain-containing protein [Chitinispirillaceae bacterium]
MARKNNGKKKKKKSFLRRLLTFFIILLILGIVGAYPAYLGARYAFNRYFEHWGDKLVNLEKRGLLSTEFGAGWQDVLMDKAMNKEAQRILEGEDKNKKRAIRVVDGITLSDYPSLSVVKMLSEVTEYSNTIQITDRRDRLITNIKTNHQRARINEIPEVLTTALIAAEDQSFRTNNYGFEFDSFVRAALRAVQRSVFSLSAKTPRGTSTITQQVAKLFISRLDEGGQRRVETTVQRKIRELRLAVALRKMYSPDEILEVYMNHAVTSDYGLIGYKDIANGLFNKKLHELSDAECIYLARMVKWGRNIKPKIAAQCRIDMGRMGDALGWSQEKRERVLDEIDKITFSRPRRIQGGHGPLVDLANEFWLKTLRHNGSSEEQIAEMDLIDPNSLVRRKGNLKIQLSIDLPLQRMLEKMVENRGFGPDTTILSEARIGSHGEDVTLAKQPQDTIRNIMILSDTVDFSEPNSSFTTTLHPGDTLISNIRYSKKSENNYRRSVFYYNRRPTLVDGQYFAYSIMCSKTGKLLAYHSKDRLGSRLNCLLKNRTPNGSSVAKPILNALNYDLGEFKPYSRWTDSLPITDSVPWSREINYHSGRPIGVVFDNSAVQGRGYKVHNFGRKFDGCRHVFDHLTNSNNILAVETIYRLNRQLYKDGDIAPGAFPLVNYFYRIGALSRIRDELKLDYVTGVRVYKELCRLAGIPVDTMYSGNSRRVIPDKMYSVALGTLEMSLYEQMHIFNTLYNNDLIEHPADHPSLVIESIQLNGQPVALNDTIRRYHPFSDINNIRPSLLATHNRLVGHDWEGLSDYDIAFQPDFSDPVYTSDEFDEDAFYLDEPVSNFGKSGTSDDILRPFNVNPSSDERTNYCLWNAVLRVDLARIAGGGKSEVRDITIACVGEGNKQYTGSRDGKSMHKYITAGLLKNAGLKAPNGYFTQYENYLRRVTPASENCSVEPEIPVVDSLGTDSLKADTVGTDSAADKATDKESLSELESILENW